MTIDFYFDFISPYSYFAWIKLQTFAKETGLEIHPIPVVFGAILTHMGHKGPAETPKKREYTIRDCLRIAATDQIPFTFVAKHPFNPLLPLRVCLTLEKAPETMMKMIDTFYKAAWQHGRDLSDPRIVEDLISEAGHDSGALIELAQQSETKQLLKARTDTAMETGVFGVPTFGFQGELFWGNDRFDALKRYINDPYQIDEDHFKQIAETPLGVLRGQAPVAEKMKSRVKKTFDNSTFMKNLGVNVEIITKNSLTTSLEKKPHLLQQHGFLHAGVLASLADHTAGACAELSMSDDEQPLSIEFKINILRPVVSHKVYCQANLIKAGKTVIVCESKVFADDKSTVVCQGIVTLFRSKTVKLEYK
ncbi:MAG: DsbA family protein [Pseudobacteriovorax sp.]|nr:DsbA family protein [Pseudobacteriovorax sp.]